MAENLGLILSRARRESVRWLHEGMNLWIFMLVTAFILAVFWLLPGELPSRTRWAGTAFEILGVASVVVGIERFRSDLGKPRIIQAAKSWFSSLRYIFIARPPLQASVTPGTIAMTAQALPPVVLVDGGSIEQRLDNLEKRMLSVQQDINRIDVRINDQRVEVAKKIASEAEERRSAIEDLRNHLEDGLLKDNSLEVAGVAFLLVGLLLANLSNEAAAAFACLGVK